MQKPPNNEAKSTGEKVIEARRNDHKKMNSDSKAEVVGWFDDVSSESGESEEASSARTRDGDDTLLANRTLRGLGHGEGERTDDVSEPPESGFSTLSSVADSSAETGVDEEVEFREPGSRRATRSTIEGNMPWTQRRYRNDTDA